MTMPQYKCPGCLTKRTLLLVDGRWHAKCLNDKCVYYRKLRQT
jgi:hypothetical protein